MNSRSSFRFAMVTSVLNYYCAILSLNVQIFQYCAINFKQAQSSFNTCAIYTIYCQVEYTMSNIVQYYWASRGGLILQCVLNYWLPTYWSLQTAIRKQWSPSLPATRYFWNTVYYTTFLSHFPCLPNQLTIIDSQKFP